MPEMLFYVRKLVIFYTTNVWIFLILKSRVQIVKKSIKNDFLLTITTQLIDILKFLDFLLFTCILYTRPVSVYIHSNGTTRTALKNKIFSQENIRILFLFLHPWVYSKSNSVYVYNPMRILKLWSVIALKPLVVIPNGFQFWESPVRGYHMVCQTMPYHLSL